MNSGSRLPRSASGTDFAFLKACVAAHECTPSALQQVTMFRPSRPKLDDSAQFQGTKRISQLWPADNSFLNNGILPGG